MKPLSRSALPRVFLLVATTLAACTNHDASDSTPRPDASARTPELSSEPAAKTNASDGLAPEASMPKPDAVPPEPVPAVVHHDVHFVTDTGQLTRLDEQGRLSMLWKTSRPVRGLAFGPEGQLYAAQGSQLRRIDGETVVELPAKPGITMVLAVGPAGEIWSLGMKLGRLEGGTWTMIPDEALASLGLGHLGDITVDAEGTLWLLGSEGLARRNGEVFERVELPDPKLRLRGFLGPAGGSVIVQRFGAIDRLEDGRWQGVSLAGPAEETAPGRSMGLREVAFGPDGSYVACDFLQRCAAVRGGVYRAIHDVRQGTVPAKEVETVALDATGRAWIATDGGLLVEPETGAEVFWGVGSVPELDGVIQRVLVRGDGPRTLPEVGTATPGTVRGTVVHDGKGVAGARVMLCPEPATRLGTMADPCDMQDPAYATRTGADGTFEIDGVEPRPYGAAVDLGREGAWVVSIDCCTALRPGRALELGRVSVSGGKRVEGMSDEEIAEIEEFMDALEEEDAERHAAAESAAAAAEGGNDQTDADEPGDEP